MEQQLKIFIHDSFPSDNKDLNNGSKKCPQFCHFPAHLTALPMIAFINEEGTGAVTDATISVIIDPGNPPTYFLSHVFYYFSRTFN